MLLSIVLNPHYSCVGMDNLLSRSLYWYECEMMDTHVLEKHLL